MRFISMLQKWSVLLPLASQLTSRITTRTTSSTIYTLAFPVGGGSNTWASMSSTTTLKKNPIDLFGIDHVVLLVDDLEGMTKWYETVLGCKVAKHNEKVKMVHLDAGNSLIDLVDKNGPMGDRTRKQKNDQSTTTTTKTTTCGKLDHLCLALYDFDEAAIKEHLESHGVAITTDTGVRYGKGGDGESLYFEDPEGTRIEIKKSCLL